MHIRDPERLEYRRFRCLHQVGIGIIFMTVAKKMQCRVNDQMKNMFLKRNAASPGLRQAGLK